MYRNLNFSGVKLIGYPLQISLLAVILGFVQQTMTSINLNKLEPYNGRETDLVFITWIYKMEYYLNLTQILNLELQINEGQQITFTSTIFTRPALVWCFTLVQSNTLPTT